MTADYILVAVQFEERGLVRFYGESYKRYREQVSMALPVAPAQKMIRSFATLHRLVR